IVIWVPSILDPTVLVRPAREDRPPSTSEAEVRGLREDKRRLEEENRTAKQEAVVKMFPLIQPDRVEEIQGILRLPEMAGITLNVSEGPSEGQFKALSRAFWGTPEREQFTFETTKCPVILSANSEDVGVYDDTGYTVIEELARPDFVIHPKGLLTLRIDCQRISSEHLTILLSKRHQIGQLELVNANVNTLLTLDERASTLAQIHTLVLRDNRAGREKVLLEVAKLRQLAERFPRLACFDVRDCQLDAEPRELSQDHIVLWTDYREEAGGGRVVHLIETPHNNILDQLNAFNQKAFRIVNKDRLDPARHLEISEHFPPVDTNQHFHCFGFCVTKLSFLRGTAVRTSHLKALMPKLSYSFPNLQYFDLSFCQLLDCDTLTHLRYFPVKGFYLNGCDAIYGRRFDSKEVEQHNRKDEYLQINRRDYLLQPHFVIRNLLHLFERGTELVRFDQTPLAELEYNQRRIEGVNNYQDYLMTFFRTYLFHEMDSIAAPPNSKPCRVVFQGSQYSGGGA
ncbi:MAG: hypothetical protein KDK64_04635, partial [Chlamydiia bacterium]|nr:hypothetical protein [Chlamydiia bacterium]